MIKSRFVRLCSAHIYILFIGLFFTAHGVHAMTCNPCLSPVGETVWKQLDRLLAGQCVGTPIRQSDVPFTITQPGIYSLCEDLVATQEAIDFEAIIFITGTHDVVLNLAGHSITLDPGNQLFSGILVFNTFRLVVCNGSLIVPEAVIGPDFFLLEIFPIFYIVSRGAMFHDLHFYGASSNPNRSTVDPKMSSVYALTLNQCHDVAVSDCIFNHIGAGVRLQGHDNALIKDCKFSDVGMAVIGNMRGLICDRCEFEGGTFAHLYPQQSMTLSRLTGSSFIDPNFNFSSPNVPDFAHHVIQLNQTSLFASSKGVVIQDCIINGATGSEIQKGVMVQTDTSFLSQLNRVEGIIIENCVINDTNSDGMNITGSRMVIRDCTVNGAGDDGISINATSSFVFVQSCEVVNSAGTNFVGVPAVTIASGEVNIPASTYWMNVALPS